jgi:hypothetical protein
MLPKVTGDAMRLQLRSARLFVLVTAMAAATELHAQTSRSQFEVGGHLAMLRLSDSDGRTNAGFGGRVSYDVLPWLTLEGEMSLFPNDLLEQRSSNFSDYRLDYERRRIEGFFGPRAGVRWNRIGVFGKVRPGFARLFNHGIGCVGEPCTRMLLAPVEYQTEFALDLGGGVEFYPTPRTVTRVDLGSTFIRHRSLAPPCRECTSRNFSSRIGVGWRF